MIRILTTLVAAIAVSSLQAQQHDVSSSREMPKLVVGITIDQLRGDYIELFKSSFSERGFKRLLNEGLVYENMKFDQPNLDASSSIATIYTGTTPFYHGIVGDKKYSIKEDKDISIFEDQNFLGNYTHDKVSPLAMLASTVTDELKLASNSASDVYAFAPTTEQAMISGGHLANGVFWLDSYNGKWSSSTFYRDFYWVVDQENRDQNSYPYKVISSQIWKPLLDINKYNAFPYTQGVVNFQRGLAADGNLTFRNFKKSPFMNQYVRETSLKVLEKADMGKRINPDFLALTFYAGSFPGAANNSSEIQDLYIRLDKDIEALLDGIDKTVGLKNTLIFVTSTGYFDGEETPNNIINRGVFHINRCEALLNMYLMAIYGNEQWVKKYHNNQIYLDRKRIEDKGLSLREVQEKAAEFVAEFTGVQDVYTAYQLKHGEWNPIMEFYKNGYSKESSGDLFVEIQPGYKIVNEQNPEFKTKVVRNNAIICPVIFFGNNIKPQRIKRTIKAIEIAPTISQVLRIRPPNAAMGQPLSELF